MAATDVQAGLAGMQARLAEQISLLKPGQTTPGEAMAAPPDMFSIKHEFQGADVLLTGATGTPSVSRRLIRSQLESLRAT